jgi:choline-sulfatase
MNTSFRENTIVVFTSDHGDLLGAHANFQKWFNIYEESIHVPMIFYSPTLLPQGVNIDLLTSHVDLLPTLCGLAGVNANQIIDQFQASYTNSRTLVGRDLSSIIKNVPTQAEIDSMQEPILFITYDQILTGATSENYMGDPYTYVSQPAFIDAVITILDGDIWKFAMYFENMDFASAPLSCTCSTPLENPPPDPEYEMYNLSEDPTETDNLAGNPSYAVIQAQLYALLMQQMHEKALQPLGTKPDLPIFPPPS